MAAPALPSAGALAEMIRAGETSSEEVVVDCLERIVATEDVLGAWARFDPDRAVAEARRRDRQTREGEEPIGPLHGVPVGIKDIVDTGDLPTSHGSSIYADHVPDADAAAVARLRAAGAVVLGKTVTTEFALFTPGPTTNPHDPSRTPGGSSSGSAAAVAAQHVPLAIGTQTAGSVVRPASFCGVVGGKPTFGAVPTDGVKPCSPSLDTVGAFARNVADVAMALGVMADDVDRFTPAELGVRPRIGLCRTPQWDQLEASTRSAFETAGEQLAGSADVVEVVLPEGFDQLVEAQVTIMTVETYRALTWERTHHADQLSDQLRRFLAGAEERVGDYDDALALADRCRAEMAAVFAQTPLLFAPSVLGEAPPISSTGDPLLCRSWTLLGTPTISVPVMTGPNGLPVGAQVIAAPHADALALAGAALTMEVLVP